MPKLRLKVDDVRLCEGNSPALGRDAIWRGEIEDCVHQDHVLRIRLDREKPLPGFVLAAINSKEVAELPIPDLAIPPQRELLEELNRQTTIADNKRAEAATLRQSAWAALESTPFAPAESSAA